jgi:4-methyl-5(b-hydroxyethyl)-thiazole monophosphate biosynthesis
MKKAYIFLAPGFEEVEAAAPADMLRRAGIEVTMVAVNKEPLVAGSHGIVFQTDKTIEGINIDNVDAVLLPGGLPGATNLAASPEVDAALHSAAQKGKIVAAICASPAVVLRPKGLLRGRRWTCYPGMQEDGSEDQKHWKDEKTVRDGSLVTSQGVGTALLFGLAVIEALEGKELAAKIGKAALVLKKTAPLPVSNQKRGNLDTKRDLTFPSQGVLPYRLRLPYAAVGLPGVLPCSRPLPSRSKRSCRYCPQSCGTGR